MKYIAIILCLIALGAGAEYNDWQQGAADGLRYGFKMGQAYQNALNGVNVTGFNAEVDRYNAWIQQNFGDDPYLMMSKMPINGIDLTGPVLIANNTTSGGIPHKIDGMSEMNGPSYTTNDESLLPKSLDLTKAKNVDSTLSGSQYLPWV
ncbi:MAG: hypothetical protein WBL92_06940 [Methanothrix sp.]